ncbi:hypothetical protein TTHERM_01002730 (macronuclear) [Tetrahymena thermophila SB210]|uniref:Uncharacterized protein n=1 Tax=Tetrahymena thermophila (strain SB210) TaxID=312017 RepID=Q22D45_TETTS|nr:hypothetical protein TTHERM_01002730 [Tetrahymena thermophila SB210]EAR83208.1 hypothetical protein TTHERM_01002730 [Tetrahymena thermophila SB210]|eukprot:XP_001030871.1 hypothetical protein TTHERM_01002730 [Tetrahymena thermophila SB210]
MKKDSFADTSDNRDHMLTLSTQSQEDEQLHHQRNSVAVENQSNKINKHFLQKNKGLEEGSDLTSESTTNQKSIDIKRGFKSTTRNKEKLSLVLNEISRAAGSRSKTSIIAAEEFSQKNSCQQKWVNTNLEDQQDHFQSCEDLDNDHDDQYKLRKTSIVSIYCKKNDITFVSSPEEFALKVMNNKSNVDEETPHLSQLQIELIISNKDCEENSHNSMQNQQQTTQTCQKKIPPQKFSTETDPLNENRWVQSPANGILQKYHAISEVEIQLEEKEVQLIEDDDYNLMISSPHSNSSYQKAIQIHNSLLKEFQNECKKTEQSASSFSQKISAFDLLISLQQNIKNY